VCSGVAISGRTPLERVEYWVRVVPFHQKPLEDDDNRAAERELAAGHDPVTTNGLGCDPPSWHTKEPIELHGVGVDGVPQRWPLQLYP
jgi:hypothetical protein